MGRRRLPGDHGLKITVNRGNFSLGLLWGNMLGATGESPRCVLGVAVHAGIPGVRYGSRTLNSALPPSGLEDQNQHYIFIVIPPHNTGWKWMTWLKSYYWRAPILI